MRRTLTTLFCLFAAVLVAAPVFAQEQGDFRTKASGDWSNPQIWETYNGSSWGPTAEPPSGSETIWVDTLGVVDSVFVDVEVSITGTLVNQGVVDVDEENSLLTIADGGTYQHDRDDEVLGDAGEIPTATWAEGSTLLMTGTFAEAPENRRQSYHHMVFDTPNLSSNLHMDLDSVTIGGDIRVLSSGIGRWYLTSTTGDQDDPEVGTNEITIMGDIIVEDGAFGVQGTSNAFTHFIVHHYGNVEVTGGNFSVSRGSQPRGTTTWYLYEGDFAMDNAETKASTQDPVGAFFVFTKDGTQTLTLGDNIDFNELPIKVASGTTLDVGTSRLEGSGYVVVEDSAAIATALAEGVAGIFSGLAEPDVQVALADSSSYIFNGTTAQVTSEVMPAEVIDLTIDNEAGVTLSQETTILGDLVLEAGEFDNTIAFTLGPDGEIVRNGGTLTVDPTSSEAEGTIPERFFVDQNYPNPFNPSTQIRYGVPSASEVSITVYNVLGQEVATLFEGVRAAGVHDVTFDAGGLSSGMYIYRVEAGDQVVSKRMILIE